MAEYIWAAALVVLLLVVLACSLLGGASWALNRFRPNGPDVGMALMVEDWTEDVPEPSVCPQCDGEGWVEHTVRGYNVEVPCDECLAWDLAERSYERGQDQ